MVTGLPEVTNPAGSVVNGDERTFPSRYTSRFEYQFIVHCTSVSYVPIRVPSADRGAVPQRAVSRGYADRTSELKRMMLATIFDNAKGPPRCRAYRSIQRCLKSGSRKMERHHEI